MVRAAPSWAAYPPPGGGVQLGDDADDDPGGHADGSGHPGGDEAQTEAGGGLQPLHAPKEEPAHRQPHHHRQSGGDVGGGVQVPAGVRGEGGTEEEGGDADAAGHEAPRHKQQGKEDHPLQKGLRHRLAPGQGRQHQVVGQDHGGGRSAHKALQKVGAKARHVAHVVAHVVSDGGGVSGIVLGDVGLRLAH